MASFSNTLNPTPYGLMDGDPVFAYEADAAVPFVRRRLGDDILSVELTEKQIWLALEESFMEYGRLINQNQALSQISNLLGMNNAFSGSVVSGTLSSSYSVTGLYPQPSLDFQMRLADAYSPYAGLGGNYDSYHVYLELKTQKQDYNLYEDLLIASGTNAGQPLMSVIPSSSVGTKLRVYELQHYEPAAAQNYLLNASNIENYLASEFNYESYVNATVFYVLPVYEDVLRRGSLETASRVRRSHYSFKIQGRNLRLFPMPNDLTRYGQRIYMRVAFDYNNDTSFNSASSPNTSYGSSVAAASRVAGPSQLAYTIIPPSSINEIGRQWVRQYCLAICKEILGRVRSKMGSIPIAGADLTLDGPALISEGREDMERLRSSFTDFLQEMTYEKILERETSKAENLQKQLRMIPIPMGRAISTG